jgi:hypothetical protein
MIDKLVKSYVDHQEKKIGSISMAAFVARANILRVINDPFMQPVDQLKFLKDAIDDLELIMNEYTKEDFKL